jgi:hypothetical protein
MNASRASTGRKLVLVFAGVVALVALVELATWARWKFHWGARCYGGLRFASNGQRESFDSTEQRWDHNALHVAWRPDGTVDRDASYRAFKRIFKRRLSDAEVAHFESTEWAACADTYFLASTIELFVREEGRHPTSLQEIVDFRHPPSFGTSRLPRDRHGRTYGYEPPAEGRPARLFTLGADGVPGGKGLDADWYGELEPDGAPTWIDPLHAERP